MIIYWVNITLFLLFYFWIIFILGKTTVHLENDNLVNNVDGARNNSEDDNSDIYILPKWVKSSW